MAADRDGWTVSLPCGVDDIDDVRAALAPYPSPRSETSPTGISAAASVGMSAGQAAGQDGFEIDIDELERP